MQLTSEDVLRYTRIGLQWLAAYLTTHGSTVSGSWIETSSGLIIGAVSFLWTLYGNRINAKLAEISKIPGTTIITQPKLANALPTNDNVVSSAEVKVVSK